MSVLDNFRNVKKLHSTEGSTGVKNLARIARALGYRTILEWIDLTISNN